jgi:O-antigen/teichoic acid export membrane protein
MIINWMNNVLGPVLKKYETKVNSPVRRYYAQFFGLLLILSLPAGAGVSAESYSLRYKF